MLCMGGEGELSSTRQQREHSHNQCFSLFSLPCSAVTLKSSQPRFSLWLLWRAQPLSNAENPTLSWLTDIWAGSSPYPGDCCVQNTPGCFCCCHKCPKAPEHLQPDIAKTKKEGLTCNGRGRAAGTAGRGTEKENTPSSSIPSIFSTISQGGSLCSSSAVHKPQFF